MTKEKESPDEIPGSATAGTGPGRLGLAPASSWRDRTRELVDVVLVAVVCALFVRTFLFQAFVVPSGSMENTVLVGDHLLVNKFIYAPHIPWLAAVMPYRDVRRGDVIVFKFPEDPTRDFIKRAVALPGDTLQVRGGAVSVNGAPEGRSASRNATGDIPGISHRRPPGDEFGPTRVPAASYFAMGDNRDSSYDSRFWGPVPARNLKGRALLVYWSLAETHGRKVNPILRAVDLLRSTRWSRTFQGVR